MNSRAATGMYIELLFTRNGERHSDFKYGFINGAMEYG